MKEEKQKVGQIRKKEIREAAKECFLNKGFQLTTMEDVITEVGMSRGGVYHHYASTNEMLKDLMFDGNDYRNNLINEYLKNNRVKDKYQQMGDILVDKSLADTELMRLYTLLLQAKKYNQDLEKLYQELKLNTTNGLSLIAKQLGIKTDIFKDDFLVNYINAMILSSEVLCARNSFSQHKKYIKETMVNYIVDIDKR
ncbi:TPA: TetR/AcrR family transcriptional regulator [Streptococcus pyogenes]|uniref:TetR/AcrR family transcriptional regulator n=1 Tax=Streptococcus pyogenes TaxID=1314 RepID=UPI0004BE446A|nr:TetR/AcrR family transcriptional regulator [Streptococcus pyogenes]MCY7047761.1 TetR/AcrR family transcriptional regulator [Streptococcus pyogenes]SDV85988.1 Transcriptional regulator, TetR family [Streptococcus pyogenes]SDV95555.1 Transcriptional regulator, TetR family [Streptococcus pyogenes]HEP6108363.1 TetR/AcrR family transcriptional regulator [Streptococcus pyogenes]HEP6123658.1 TetR/AcrR family transcriptional regulator [Streptococcus pyogenes]